jgi:hypothetical protein
MSKQATPRVVTPKGKKYQMTLIVSSTMAIVCRKRHPKLADALLA